VCASRSSASGSTGTSDLHAARVHFWRPTGSDPPLNPLAQARRIAALAGEKLAKDVVVLDLRPASGYTDFFVICTGQNPRQTKAIFDEVYAGMKREHGIVPRSSDGVRESTWVIADYLDSVLHVFTPEARAFYRLEELWGDVPVIELEAEAAAS